MICNLRSWRWLRLDFRVMVGISKISSEKFVHSFFRCNQGINVLREFELIQRLRLFRAKRFFTFPCVASKQHYLCSWEFMNSGFIIAHVFSVNIVKNRISILIRKKELQRFASWEGWYKKRKLMLMGLVQEGGIFRIIKFPTRILLEKDS